MNAISQPTFRNRIFTSERPYKSGGTQLGQIIAQDSGELGMQTRVQKLSGAQEQTDEFARFLLKYCCTTAITIDRVQKQRCNSGWN
jgi:hypothetical protein